MAQADRQEKRVIRLEIANMRVTTAERDYLRRVAIDRCVSMSDVMRQALRNDGALPPE